MSKKSWRKFNQAGVASMLKEKCKPRNGRRVDVKVVKRELLINLKLNCELLSGYHIRRRRREWYQRRRF